MNSDLVFKKYSGSMLRQIRLERNMTQQDLAKQLTDLKKIRTDHSMVTRQTVSKYENGERGMNLEMISDLSVIFQVPVSYFFPNTVSLETTLQTQTHNLFTKTVVDDEGFSLEIKTAVPFDELNLEDQKEIMDSAMEELLKLKREIKNTH